MTNLTRTNEFIVSKDHEDDVSITSEELKELKSEGYTIFCQCYDDDDILYYSGYIHKDCADEFCMVDWAMYDSGATYCKIRNSKNGLMEHL